MQHRLPQERIGIHPGDVTSHIGTDHSASTADADRPKVVVIAGACSGIGEEADERLDDLSGGQRQRAWVAMTSAQKTDILLLDEPTTHLDLAHAIDVLELVDGLHRTSARAVAMLLHDVFGLAAAVVPNPVDDGIVILPRRHSLSELEPTSPATALPRAITHEVDRAQPRASGTARCRIEGRILSVRHPRTSRFRLNLLPGSKLPLLAT